MVEHISNGEKKVKKEKKKRGIYDSAYVGKGTHRRKEKEVEKNIHDHVGMFSYKTFHELNYLHI